MIEKAQYELDLLLKSCGEDKEAIEMRREIIFRGKSVKHGWLVGYLLISKDKKKNRYYISDGRQHEKSTYSDDRQFYGYEVIPETIGQYTGLCDKEGNKIFEGDIVKCELVDIVKKGKKWVNKITYQEFICEWSECKRGFRFYDNGNKNGTIFEDGTIFVDCRSEIIGNIYDNQELIKEND